MRRARRHYYLRGLGDFTDDLNRGLITLPGFSPGSGPGSGANPALGTDVRMPDGTFQHFDAVQDANGNYVSPKIFISDSLPGGYAAAMPGTPEYSHYSSVMNRDNVQGAIKVAALVGGAAVASAFLGAAATSTVTDTAATSAAASSAEIAPITLPASATILPTTVAPTILSPTATLLTMPTFDAAAVAPIADAVTAAVNTPEMQAAIAAGAVPAPPASLLGTAFKDWAVSTGLNVLKQQVGAALTAAQQKKAEDAMAAEVARLQSQWAANGGPGATQADFLSSLLEHPLLLIAAGGAIAYLIVG